MRPFNILLLFFCAIFAYVFIANLVMELSSSLMGYTNYDRDLLQVPANEDESEDGNDEVSEDDDESANDDGNEDDNDEVSEEDNESGSYDNEDDEKDEEEEDTASSTDSNQNKTIQSSSLRPIYNKKEWKLVKKRGRKLPKIKLFNGTKSCFLEDSLIFLACGWDGHVYVANMTCPWGTSPIAVKIGTVEKLYKDLDHDDKDGITKLQFQTELTKKGKSEQDLEDFHHKMVSPLSSSSSSSEVDVDEQHVKSIFAFFYGTVRIPAQMLVPSIGRANWICHKDIISLRHSHDREKKFVGKIMNYIPKEVALDEIFSRRSKQNAISNELKYDIIRQIIFMYSYLYDRDIVHCDILNFFHFLYDEPSQQVTLVDFERIQIFENRTSRLSSSSSSSSERKWSISDRHNKQLWQHIQLLTLIGNICNVHPRKSSYYPSIGIPKACSGDHIDVQKFKFDFDPLQEQLSKAFLKCTYKTNLFTKDKFSIGEMTLDQIGKSYETLRSWAAAL